MSLLQPETLQLLRGAREGAALFSNPMAATGWYAKHTIGPCCVHPRADGKYLVYDARRPVGSRTVSVHDKPDEAHAALAAHAAAEP